MEFRDLLAIWYRFAWSEIQFISRRRRSAILKNQGGLMVNAGAQKRMGGPKREGGAGGGKVFGIAIRGSKEWRDWVMDLADFRRLKATDLIDQALVEYAERHGFNPSAPKR